MLHQFIITLGITLWACGLWALLPKALSLHLRQQNRLPKALTAPVRRTWKPGALAAASLLVMILIRFSEN